MAFSRLGGRPLVLIALPIIALGAGVLGGCSGAGHDSAPPVPVTHPAPGNNTPAAAAMGFFTEYAAGNHNACQYVIQSVALDCLEAFESETATVSGLGIGATTIQGNEALVTVVAKLCVTQGKTPTCRTNTDPSTGQPKHNDQSEFQRLYKNALQGESVSTSAVPCEKVGTQWFLSLAG